MEDADAVALLLVGPVALQHRQRRPPRRARHRGTYALTYWLASYSLNGTYLGLEKLGTQLQLWRVASDLNAYLSFAPASRRNARCPRRGSSPSPSHVLDLYLQVEGEKLYPVPTRVINLRVGGARVNDNASSRAALENDQLVRRFFVVDGQSGRKPGESAPTVVRYLSAATLTVKTQKDLPNRIYAPVLELEYAEVRVATGADGALAASSRSCCARRSSRCTRWTSIGRTRR